MINPKELDCVPIIPQLKKYLETRLRLAKYQAIQKGTAIAAEFAADLTILFFLLVVLLFASLMLSYFLASLLKSTWAGFGCVTVIYILTGLGICLFKKWFERYITKDLIVKFTKNKHQTP